MNIYVVGRIPDTSRAHIRLEDRSISAHHGRLFELDDGSFEFLDDGSTNGTYTVTDETWVRAGTAYLSADQPLRLGAFETTPRDLLKLVKYPAPPPKRLMRDPKTGEIVPVISRKS